MENCYAKMTNVELVDSLEKLKAYRDDPNNTVVRDIFVNHITEVEEEMKKRELLTR